VSDENESVVELMLEQWQSMTGMAAMFIGTIAIGLFIQPLYDVPEARAFGEEGTTKSGFILFELVMIGIFTFLIIWLARKGLGTLIKGFVMLALWFSLLRRSAIHTVDSVACGACECEFGGAQYADHLNRCDVRSA
jgi:hypothetical protein